ncbi:MAG: PEP-CTERM sorting domain-containing protein [Myxococcota bacterium]|nr:PEP-CTERM sorting domain-containing protein [Myxococcota bacterium]
MTEGVVASSPPVLSFTAVPEPSSALLVAVGLAGLAGRRRPRATR